MNNPDSDLLQLLKSAPERIGWDFSRIKDDVEPRPWDYLSIVKAWLSKSDHVLDLDTGGGEKFIALADCYKSGFATDSSAEQIQVCNQNLAVSLRNNIQFVQSDARKLTAFDDASFDKVINRHGAFSLAEAYRVLKPGGIFITQQVGEKNTLNVYGAFGYSDATAYWRSRDVETETWSSIVEGLIKSDFEVVAKGEYNLDYYFLGNESFIFWLKAIEIPYPFEPEQHVEIIKKFIAENQTERGIKTNEQRHLLILRKPRHN